MLKTALKRAIHGVGFDLRRYNPDATAGARYRRLLATHNVNLVLDVGANTGQFARSLRALGYQGRIVSFEPIAAAWQQLVESSRSDALWEVAPRGAVGEANGEAELHISENSCSSSILNILDPHVEAMPTSAYVRTESVPVRRLDEVAAQYLREDPVSFLKIDTQGYEAQVLRGAPELLRRCVGLCVELSLTPLYARQSLYREVAGYLEERGFELWDIATAFADPRTERILQIDATFFRA